LDPLVVDEERELGSRCRGQVATRAHS
jgi:hypothetical protein